MKRHYISAKRFSLWLRLEKKWRSLYEKVSITNFDVTRLKKLNKISFVLGLKRRILLSSLAGFVTVGAQAQVDFKEVTDTTKLYFSAVNVESSSSPVFADVDGDGKVDLVVGNKDGELSFFDGAHEFGEKTGTDNPFDGIDVGKYSRPAFADVDGDGDLDLVVGADDGKLNYYTNSNAVFTPQTGANNPFDAFTLSNIPNGGNFYTTRANPVFVDLDNDGDQDLVLGDYFGSDRYYTSNGSEISEQTAVFTEQTDDNNPFSTITDWHYATSFADIDDDGDEDLILGHYEGEITYYTNHNNVFTELSGTDNPFDTIGVNYQSHPIFEDIDDDGDLDLFIGGLYGGIKEYINLDKTPTGLFDTDLNKKTLNIYPNPATLSINTEEGALEILDLTGNLVLTTDSNGKVDVSGLESGVYFIAQNGKRTKLIIE